MRKQKGPSRHEWREGGREAVSFPLTSAPHERDSLMSVDTVVTWWPPLALLHEHAIQHTTLGPDIDIPRKNADSMSGRMYAELGMSTILLHCVLLSSSVMLYNQRNLPILLVGCSGLADAMRAREV